MTSTRYLVAAIAAAAFFVSPARAVLIDFDVASDYNTDFNEVLGGVDSLSHSSATGVGGQAGRLNVLVGTTSDTTGVYTPSSFDLSSGNTFTLSIFFLIPNPIGGSAEITAAQIGFVETTSTGFLGSGSFSYVSARVRSSATGSTYYMQGQSAQNGSATNYNTTSAFTLTAGNWYQLTSEFTRNGSSVNYSARVDDRGVNGNGTASLVQSISGTMAALDMSVDSTAFAALRSNGNANQKVVALDDFSVVPEPTAGLLAFAGLGLLVARRRRTR